MRELGDFFAGQTVSLKFNTNTLAGVPISLAGDPMVRVYRSGTADETAAGVTLAVDFDSIVGLNQVTVDTGALATYYTVGHDYDVVLAAGTVAGTSVAGTVLGSFSLANRTDALAGPSPYGAPPPEAGPGDAAVFVDVATTRLYEDALSGKPRGARLDQGSPAWLRAPLVSRSTGGQLVVTLNPYGGGAGVRVRYREATGVDPCVYVPDEGVVPGLSEDGTTLLLPVPVEVKDTPGVYVAQALVYAADGTERLRDEFWLVVDRGLFLSTGAAPGDDRGPPTVAELRTALRDHPGANRLLGDYEFDAAELGQAVVAAVQAFNTEFPPLPRPFTTRTLPAAVRRPLLDGALAFLYETAAAYHRRGMLPYQAAGLTVNDLAKEKDYLAAAQFHRARFDRWNKLVRATMNYAAGWGSIGGTLGY